MAPAFISGRGELVPDERVTGERILGERGPSDQVPSERVLARGFLARGFWREGPWREGSSKYPGAYIADTQRITRFRVHLEAHPNFMI